MGYTLTRTLTTHLYLTNPCLILFQCDIASYFLRSLSLSRKNPLSQITRVSDYNVYESRDPNCQLMKCHAVTTLPFTSLAATKKQDGEDVRPIISA